MYNVIYIGTYYLPTVHVLYNNDDRNTTDVQLYYENIKTPSSLLFHY